MNIDKSSKQIKLKIENRVGSHIVDQTRQCSATVHRTISSNSILNTHHIFCILKCIMNAFLSLEV